MDKSFVQEKYYTYQDECQEYSVESKILYLKYLISLNDSVYDPYVLLMEIYFRIHKNEEAVKIIQQGYNTLLENEFNNTLPQKLDYYELENRPIFRLIYNYADTFWFLGNKEEAIKLFRKLIEMHPSDNIGARYAICGILEGYDCSNHIWSEHNNNIKDWFSKSISNHIDNNEFKWLKTYL